MTRSPILIDCDPGLDDAVALLLALRSPEIDVVGVTAASGNLPASQTFVNVHRILEFAGRPDIPTGRGPDHPLVGDLVSDPFSHGPGGLGGREFPAPAMPQDVRWAPDLICELADAHAGELVLITLAPLTNVALALLRRPELASQLARVVVLGGNFGRGEHAWRNGTGDNPVSEWNVYVDPEAAAIVFDSGMALTAIGLDSATDPRINLTADEITGLSTATPFGSFAAEMARFVEGRGFQNYCALIDAVAVAFAVQPALAVTSRERCGVELNGRLTRGMTVVDSRHHHAWAELPTIEIVSQVDYAGLKRLLLDRLSTT